MTVSTPASASNERRWLLMAFVAVAQLMVVLDATIVNIALPSAQKDLGFGDGSRQWIVTAYALAFGSLLLFGGRLGDRFGRKIAFVVGLLGFAVASALGGAAGSFGLLVTSRALQGMFGALLAPAALSILVTTFTDPKDRAKAFGIFGAVAVSGGGIGLILGGVLTEFASWRWSMYVNIFFAVPAAVGVLVLMPSAKSSHRPHIDLVGTVLASLGLFGIVFGFSRAETNGWGATSTLISLGVGAALLIAFVFSQSRFAHPLLPLRIPANRTRGGAYLSVALSMAAVFGLFLFLTYYLQAIKGYSPLKSGLAYLPMTGCMIIMSNLSSLTLLPRFGARKLIPVGMLAGVAGTLLLSTIDPASGYMSTVLPAILLIGVAQGSIISPAMNTATFGVAPGDAGVASALVNTSLQVGGSIGASALSTVAATATAGYVGLPAAAATHGFATGFLYSAMIYAAGALIVVAVLPRALPRAARRS